MSFLVLLVILAVLLDQITKIIIISTVSPYNSIPIIQNIFHITYVQNSGTFFGLFKEGTKFFIFISVIAIFVITTFLLKNMSKLKLRQKLSLAFILSGAIGNLIDRLRLGYVVDFLDFRVWPVFNLADSFITIGAIMLIFSMMPK